MLVVVHRDDDLAARAAIWCVRELKQSGLALEPFIDSVTAHPPLRVPGTAVFLTANIDAVPHALLHNLKHNKVLHERNVLLTVETLETPTAESGERIEITALGHEFYQRRRCASVLPRIPNVPPALQIAARRKACGFDMMDTTFFLSRETHRRDAHRPAWRCGATSCSRSWRATRCRPRRSSRFPAIG